MYGAVSIFGNHVPRLMGILVYIFWYPAYIFVFSVTPVFTWFLWLSKIELFHKKSCRGPYIKLFFLAYILTLTLHDPRIFFACILCTRSLTQKPAVVIGRENITHVFFSFKSHSTRLLAATTLRNVLGTKNLAEILSERETISHIMQTSLDEATDPWGVKVERVEM